MRLFKPLMLALLSAAAIWGPARAETATIRMTWYSDGNEGEVMADLLKRFEEQNKDVKVVLDQVPFKAINENLPVQVASGQGPDIARVVDIGGLSRYYLDMRPHLKDAAYWEQNFGPFLEWMRPAGDTQSIPGFMTQLTVTGPFVNKTLFDQAKVPMPGAKATWEDWAKATKEVAAKVQVPFPIALDRSGHRFYSLAMSQGTKVFGANGEPEVVDEGFKRAAQLVYDWHASGVMSKELWGSVSGTAYRGANDEFKNAQVVLYLSGSWQTSQFDKTVGNAFDWIVVPNPCGPGGCSSMPGGAALVAFKSTQHPKEVARLMDYLASEPVLSEFYSRTLFVPGHLGLAKKGVAYPSASPQAAAALKTFTASASEISPLAYRTQGYTNSRIIFNAVISRLGQAIAGETTLDEAYKRITSDVAQQIAERAKK
ncbi:ABC transporter substrate-binding protein [Chelatococcus asaccharovorans]|uniref:Carbohydrate ABC transporter substrate-binding protein (CUT1 family) n=1 Tax=Chelatococcus asaccharovorans TaxID=28210 RepID=A0A2V3UHZ5_9HYPH|nr:extracellular solute-binding protein [Chelatococcus asaccharovorans]MBS7706593.1 extracellular solute-binding protein [Chelatococcus asaccharovorans]PXW64759.1 carbohydrate ABC transporter substrate-binding protein (CUT1 family) [Chelatococcus asaccharovorans]CAH1663300.1 Carbohydrate ABC transporter substrate-binding protein (CUT1 family) [Chelatococcus asaccharovorans]CAH1682854.1 Carbohydrate ABC transporter substrate-binding protein (CUT1 family) [Chelatococcus asaccharovorans]